MDQLTGMQVFRQVVDSGSFALAGQQLGISAPMVSKHVAQFRSLAAQPGKDPGRAIAILNASAVDRAGEQVAAGVGDYMAFAAFDPLARVEAGKGRVFRGFYALAIDYAGCRLRLASRRLARPRNQRSIDLRQKPIVAPAVEIIPYRRDWWEIARQERPSASRGRDILDGIPDLAQVNFSRTSQTGRAR